MGYKYEYDDQSYYTELRKYVDPDARPDGSSHLDKIAAWEGEL